MQTATAKALACDMCGKLTSETYRVDDLLEGEEKEKYPNAVMACYECFNAVLEKL